MNINYYYLIGSKNYFLKNEPIEEILRERAQYYKHHSKVIDFWIIPELNCLEKILPENILCKIKKLEDFICIVSTNKKFIDWLNLRFINALKYELVFEEKNPFGKKNKILKC